MKYAPFLAATLLVGVAGTTFAQAQQGIDLVKQAIEAEGGVDALRALKAEIGRAHV